MAVVVFKEDLLLIDLSRPLKLLLCALLLRTQWLVTVDVRDSIEYTGASHNQDFRRTVRRRIRWELAVVLAPADLAIVESSTIVIRGP